MPHDQKRIVLRHRREAARQRNISLAVFDQHPQTTRTHTQLVSPDGTELSEEMIARMLAPTAGCRSTTAPSLTPRRSASPPAFPARPRAQMERRPLAPEFGLEDVEASLLSFESYPARLAPPPATLPGSLPRPQLSRGSQASDIVPASDRRALPGPNAPPGSMARAQLSSVTAADIIKAFPDVPRVPAWMTCLDAPAGPPPNVPLAALPAGVLTARDGRVVMSPGSARIVDVHPRPTYTGPLPGRPQAPIPGSSARVTRVPSGCVQTGALPDLPSGRNPASRPVAPIAGSAARVAAHASANRFGLRIPDASASTIAHNLSDEAEADHESVFDPLSEAFHNHFSLHNAINPNTTLERLNNPLIGNACSVSVVGNTPAVLENSANAGDPSVGPPSAGPSAPLSEEKHRKNQKKNTNRKAKKAAAKAETNDSSDQGDDGDDAILTNALPINPAMNQPTAIPAKGRGKMKADDDIPTNTSPRDKGKYRTTAIDTFAASITAAENWMKPSTTATTNTMIPEDTQTMGAHFMAKFRKIKGRHRAISPPRQTTQCTTEKKYQHVIAGMLKRQGVTSSVKTRTQVRHMLLLAERGVANTN